MRIQYLRLGMIFFRCPKCEQTSKVWSYGPYHGELDAANFKF